MVVHALSNLKAAASRVQVGTLAYIVSFALGAGPVPGLLVPEITPTRLRGAHSLAQSLFAPSVRFS